ncbi:unnamed protein product [Rhizophagus irregularis]|nr:unnamed protein product [Rhizophagus irregularis]
MEFIPGTDYKKLAIKTSTTNSNFVGKNLFQRRRSGLRTAWPVSFKGVGTKRTTFQPFRKPGKRSLLVDAGQSSYAAEETQSTSKSLFVNRKAKSPYTFHPYSSWEKMARAATGKSTLVKISGQN